MYDITKSKRTRRPALVMAEWEANEVAQGSPTKESDDKEENDDNVTTEEQKNNGHVKLKQLIKAAEKGAEEKGKGRALLGQHFADEKQQLQLVLKQKTEDGAHSSVKFKRVIKRYVKALSHLVKVKRDQRLGKLDKPVLRLTK